MESSQDRKKVQTRARAPFWVLVWEVVLHIRHFYTSIVQLSHRYFIVSRRVTKLDLVDFEQLLLTLEDLLEVG